MTIELPGSIKTQKHIWLEVGEGNIKICFRIKNDDGFYIGLEHPLKKFKEITVDPEVLQKQKPPSSLFF